MLSQIKFLCILAATLIYHLISFQLPSMDGWWKEVYDSENSLILFNILGNKTRSLIILDDCTVSKTDAVR